MIKKETVAARYDEKYIKTVILYADGSDKLFYDKSAKVNKVAKEDLKDLFMKGITIFKSDVYYKPICLKTEGVVGHDGTSAVTFTIPE